MDVGTVEQFNEYVDTLIVDVLDALDATAAPIVSTSLGGCFALRTAAAHGARVDRILEFGYVVGAPLRHIPSTMRIATLPAIGRFVASIPPTRGAVRLIMRQLGLGPALAVGRISDESFEWFVSLLRNEARLPRELLTRDVAGCVCRCMEERR